MCCPLCECHRVADFRRWSAFAILRCLDCGFRFVDTEAPAYPRDAQYVYDEPEIGRIDPDQPHIRRRVRDIRRHACPPGRALDIGCGKGEVSIALSGHGFTCVGIDMKPRLIEHLQYQYPSICWRCAMTSDLEGGEEAFDVITVYHVLEHVTDPVNCLKSIARLARPGALVVVEVPNAGGLEARITGSTWSYCKVDHVNYFRPADLRRAARQAGLRVLECRGYQHFSYPQDVLWKDLIKGALAAIGFKNVVSVFLRVP